MSRSLMDKMLSSRRKLMLGLIWGLLLTCALVLPDVDSSINQYRELGILQAKLATRAQLPKRARLLAERLGAKEEETAALRTPLVPPERLSAFTEELTQMARVANCRMRSIRPGAARRRAFEEVLEGRPPEVRPATQAALWEVEEQTSLVSLQGSFGNLMEFLSALDHNVRILQFSNLYLHTPPEGSAEIILELRIKTFNVVKQRKE